MKYPRNRLVVDTVGNIQFPEGDVEPGVMLGGTIEAIRTAAKHWGSGVVLLGCDDIPALVSRIEDAMRAVHDMDVDFRDYATAIACDLIGKDLDEALRERREAEDAA